MLFPQWHRRRGDFLLQSWRLHRRLVSPNDKGGGRWSRGFVSFQPSAISARNDEVWGKENFLF